MKRLLLVLLAVAMLATLSTRANAVNFEDELKKLGEENAIGYIGPFSTAFGTAMNSGYYHTAKLHGWLGFDLGIKMSMVTVPTEGQTFESTLPALPFVVPPEWGVDGDQLSLDMNYIYPDRESPTVFGDDQSKILESDQDGIDIALTEALVNAGKSEADILLLQSSVFWGQLRNEVFAYTQDNEIITPMGTGIDVLPMVVPQVSVGLPFKTEVMLRYIPEIDAGDIGKVKFFGFGVKHNLSQYIPIPLFPVKISGQFAWQKLEIGDLITSTHWAANVHASKQLGFGVSVTPYVGVGIESSTIDVEYTIEGTNSVLDGTPIAFSLDGENTYRLTGGVKIGLPLVSINADYSLGEYSVVSIGVAISFR